VRLFRGDCTDIHLTLPDSSVNLILTDPPYFRVKNEPWDRQWDTAAGYLEWFGGVCEQWERVLAPNGSLYVFASPKMAARVECKVGERFNVLNHLVWNKPVSRAQSACKEALRGYFGDSERIIFAEHYGSDNYAKGEAGYGAKCDELRGFVFEPLRAYLDGERRRAGVTPEQCNVICGHREQGGMAGRHYFSDSQWCLPTAENYAKLRSGFSRLNHGGEYLRREYEDLRREYEDLRRPFSVSAQVPYTDVWDFATVQAYAGKHPCEKPLDMLEHIISASSRPGDVVLDSFMGSGNTGIAAQKLGRRFIGIDASEHWHGMAERRIAEARAQPVMI
jgi:adenine-specific DNA-methyltransferase